MKSRLIVIVTCLSLLLTSCITGEAIDYDYYDNESDTSTEIKKVYASADVDIDRAILEREFNGTVLVAVDGDIKFQNSYGNLDFEGEEQIDGNSIFSIASLTKQFTATAILMLEEDGLLSTEDTISQYIEHHPRGDEITIHHLLTNTSGIPDYWETLYSMSFSDYKALVESDAEPEELLEVINALDLKFDPGTAYEYSNSNFFLAGCIIEKASGMPYETYLKENIFEPLGMTSTSMVIDQEHEQRTTGYVKSRNDGDDTFTLVPVNHINTELSFAAGGLQSTATDLLKWDQGLYHELLSDTSLSKMYTAELSNYGYGWHIIKDNIVVHEGYVQGYMASIYRDLNKKKLVVVLTNISGEDSKEDADFIQSILRAQY